ncbi:type ISP restriction/modification enzyme [Sedimentisphaera salicampi]|uniref:type ISP restriction/modification enzyme n=1 Tax=Sedimentisphaera salicampi TaxID=1941349 RepID=UPI000B9BA523|nr:type ISP restriction/modification enzyme [Sedimentisphaera salicampi]OXU15100.1 putative helicase [Sedimentisphaera salicampi]
MNNLKLKDITTCEELVEYLRNELDWPLESTDIEEITYDYSPDELGIKDEAAAKINVIRQLMPLSSEQVWGVFFVEFENKKLSVTALRKILGQLVIKKRASSQNSQIQSWQAKDLMFISSCGQEGERGIKFAHFSDSQNSSLPVMKVLSWDEADTTLHTERADDILKQHLLWPEDETDKDSWREKWSSVFVHKDRHVIKTSKDLVSRLANLAKQIRDRAMELLELETDQGPFRKMMEQFRKALIHELDEEKFADMYAQTITYGLLYNAIRNQQAGGSGVVSADRARQLILPTNKFLTEIMQSFFDVGVRKYSQDAGRLTGIDFDAMGVNDIIDTLSDSDTDMDAVLRDFGNKNPTEDPVLHFYEHFLSEYDSLLRKGRGVYYTPQPVVSFIVRSVHEALKRDYGLELGLADMATWQEVSQRIKSIQIPAGVNPNEQFVKILDPAAGTGTFLETAIDVIKEELDNKWQSEGKSSEEITSLWSRYVPKSLLPRLCGFELMMAPYSIAHMKIGIKLFETGYSSFEQDSQRVRLYLTNTLEAPVQSEEYLQTCEPAMAEEAEQANRIKKLNSVTVVIGNPPYSGHSANNSEWSYNLLRNKLPDGADSYFKVDGQELEERNSKWLNDDYVKFIRYAQYKLACSGNGVLGFITNHGYLDNPTFRGMRQSLLTSFNSIGITDLHGNSKKREKCPDGSKDENVFNIQQGVSIIEAEKKPSKNPKITHRNMYGLKANKYKICSENSNSSLKKKDLNPQPLNYFFAPQDIAKRNEFESFLPINEIIKENSVGIVTGGDAKAVANDIKKAKELASQNKVEISYITKVLYRPFDKMNLVYHKKLVTRMRLELMRHMLSGENLGLIGSRQLGKSGELPVFITNKIVEGHSITTSTSITYLYPLYLYPEGSEGLFSSNSGSVWPKGKDGRVPNLDKGVVSRFASALGLDFVSEGRGNLEDTFGPENLLGYIYAVLHSPEYRERYSEFLKYEFPRIPICLDRRLFSELSIAGSELILLHLMESEKKDNFITSFPAEGDNSVTKVGEKNKQLSDLQNGRGRLYINSSQYFEGIPEEVWNFHVGGYQVCYKWLYDRKKAGKKLSDEDIRHYQQIVAVLSETIKLMSRIDKVINSHGGWPVA